MGEGERMQFLNPRSETRFKQNDQEDAKYPSVCALIASN